MVSTCTSVRAGARGMSELLTSSQPPGCANGSNLSSEGRFMTMTQVASVTMGAPISSSEMMTLQLAVPPRISGP